MKKKDLVTVLKRKFLDPSVNISQMKKVKDLYKEVKGLILADNDDVPKAIEEKYKKLF